MARISGIDIPKNKRGAVALTYIFGIGNSRAKKILASRMDFSTGFEEEEDEDIKGGKKRRQIKSNYRRKTVKKLRNKS